MSKPNTSQASKQPSRTRSRSRIKYKAGKITRNPFLNFLRDFRKNNKGLKLIELTKRGAQVWRKMNEREKSPYCSLARQAPAKRYRRRSSRSRRKAKAARRRRRSRSHSVVINESNNRVISYRKDDGGNASKEASEPKIIELPPDDGDDSVKPLEVIDLT